MRTHRRYGEKSKTQFKTICIQRRSTRTRTNKLGQIELFESGLHDRILHGAEHKLNVFSVWSPQHSVQNIPKENKQTQTLRVLVNQTENRKSKHTQTERTTHFDAIHARYSG